MTRIVLALTLTVFFCFRGAAQVDSVRHRVFLVGDAGNLFGDTHPVAEWLKKNVDWDDTRNRLIYLGDNIYPGGLPFEGEGGYDYSKKVIDAQIGVVKGKKAEALFVMGNHDWWNGKIGGWERAMALVAEASLAAAPSVD